MGKRTIELRVMVCGFTPEIYRVDKVMVEALLMGVSEDEFAKDCEKISSSCILIGNKTARKLLGLATEIYKEVKSSELLNILVALDTINCYNNASVMLIYGANDGK